jgi:hypothetical protein
MKNPYHLLESGNYKKAMVEYTRLLAKYPADECLLDGYPFACLCTGRLVEALDGFLQSNARAKLKPIGHEHPYLREIAAVQWLLDRREEAVRTLRFSVDGILDGTIEYADATGGTPQGLLLWYMGVSMGDNATRDHALAFLQTVLDRQRIDDSPGVAEFVIGKLSRDQLLRVVFSTRTMWLVRLQANIRIHKKYMLSNIWFYFGVHARARGDEAECQRCMLECSRLKYSASNLEWHLAKAEVANYRASR